MDCASLRSRGKWLLSVAFLGVVAWLLIARGTEIDWAEVLRSLRRYSGWVLAAAFALSVSGYLACCSYDLLARHYVRHAIPAPTVLGIAFVCYAVNMNLGALLGGLGFRYRLYSRYGLEPAQIAQIVGLGVVTNWSGFILLAGFLLLLGPNHLQGSWEIGGTALKGMGALLLGVAAAYVLFCAAFQGRSREIRGLRFECPTPVYALLQMAVSSANWLAVSTAVALLMPQNVEFSLVMLAFMASGVGGLIVRLPAGIGVLEGSFIGILGGSVGHGRLLAALLAFRAVYYIVPLIIALPGHLALELRARRRRLQAA